MKISLISIRDLTGVTSGEEPGLGAIASYMRRKGHEILVSVVDCMVLNMQEIVDFNPQIIGFTAYNMHKNEIIEISKLIKDKMPLVIICAGGPMPTYYYTEFLQEAKCIDFVVIGEGEITFLEVVNHIENNSFETCKKNIDGIAYLQDGLIYKTNERKHSVDMDTLPYPSKDLLKKNKVKSAFINGSRGCLKRCTFCCSHDFWSLNGCNGWKSRKITSMVDEIEYIAKNHDIYSFLIPDNSFEDTGIEKVMDFAQDLICRKIDVSYWFSLRSETCKEFTSEDFHVLKKSGLVGVFLGIESGNSEDLKLYGKTATVQDNIQAIRLLTNNGLSINAGFININPYSTVAKLLKNISFLHEHFDSLLVAGLNTHLRLYRGTRLNDLFVKKGLFDGMFDAENYKFDVRNMDKFSEYIKKFSENIIVKHLNGAVSPQRYRHTLENLKRRINESSVNEQINVMEQTINNSIKEINDMVATWYTKLVNTVDNWNNEHAGQITNEYFHYNLLMKYKNETAASQNKLIMALEKNTKEGSSILRKYY